MTIYQYTPTRNEFDSPPDIIVCGNIKYYNVGKDPGRTLGPGSMEMGFFLSKAPGSSKWTFLVVSPNPMYGKSTNRDHCYYFAIENPKSLYHKRFRHLIIGYAPRSVVPVAQPEISL